MSEKPHEIKVLSPAEGAEQPGWDMVSCEWVVVVCVSTT